MVVKNEIAKMSGKSLKLENILSGVIQAQKINDLYLPLIAHLSLRCLI